MAFLWSENMWLWIQCYKQIPPTQHISNRSVVREHVIVDSMLQADTTNTTHFKQICSQRTCDCEFNVTSRYLQHNTFLTDLWSENTWLWIQCYKQIPPTQHISNRSVVREHVIVNSMLQADNSNTTHFKQICSQRTCDCEFNVTSR
jgi:hypothetical protein